MAPEQDLAALQGLRPCDHGQILPAAEEGSLIAFTNKTTHVREAFAPNTQLEVDYVSAIGAAPGGRAVAAGLVALIKTLGTHPEGVSIDAVLSVGISVTTSLATIQVQFRPAL